MNANQFLTLIQKTEPFDRSEILQLQKLQENFPYLQIPHVLLARYDYQKDPTEISTSLGFAAITSPDRIWLKTLIQNSGQEAVPSQVIPPISARISEDISLISSDVQETEIKTEVIKPPIKRRKPFKDDLIETIRKREKKEIIDEKKREQIDLIKTFSKKSIKMATIKEIEANQNHENLAAASTKINDNLISESYAKILALQGKKAMAKEIYEKLILKFPDKRAYFANLIEELKD